MTSTRVRAWAGCLGFAMFLAGCHQSGTREERHTQIDQMTQARLELRVVRSSGFGPGRFERKILHVVTLEGSEFTYEESPPTAPAPARLQVTRQGRVRDADAGDWNLYRQYLRNFEEDLRSEPGGPVQPR